MCTNFFYLSDNNFTKTTLGLIQNWFIKSDPNPDPEGSSFGSATRLLSRTGNSLIRSSLIRSQNFGYKNLKFCFTMFYLRGKKKIFLCEWIAHFAKIKWAMWANRSFGSQKMSDHEQFVQVAQRNWAMWANCSFCSQNMSEWVNR